MDRQRNTDNVCTQITGTIVQYQGLVQLVIQNVDLSKSQMW